MRRGASAPLRAASVVDRHLRAPFGSGAHVVRPSSLPRTPIKSRFSRQLFPALHGIMFGASAITGHATKTNTSLRNIFWNRRGSRTSGQTGSRSHIRRAVFNRANRRCDPAGSGIRDCLASKLRIPAPWKPHHRVVRRSSFACQSLRNVSSTDATLTRDVASLFITPGVRVKFFPNSRIAPYAAIGGGWADYEQSTLTLDGRANNAPRTVNHGAFDYGGGVDVKLWRFLGLRTEIRDFYTGSPSYNTGQTRGGQHNVVAGGGLVLSFGRE